MNQPGLYRAGEVPYGYPAAADPGVGYDMRGPADDPAYHSVTGRLIVIFTVLSLLLTLALGGIDVYFIIKLLDGILLTNVVVTLTVGTFFSLIMSGWYLLSRQGRKKTRVVITIMIVRGMVVLSYIASVAFVLLDVGTYFDCSTWVIGSDVPILSDRLPSVSECENVLYVLLSLGFLVSITLSVDCLIMLSLYNRFEKLQEIDKKVSR